MCAAKTFAGVFNDKNVLVSGHTGFKGSWLAVWLLELGANVVGYALDPPSEPSHFAAMQLENRLKHVKGDVRDKKRLEQVFREGSFDIVFHLAAQAITRRSYEVPEETFSTNVSGTVNILECMRCSNTVKAAVLVTSDKCYQNNEWLWGYREDDRLGGNDPYSASKACAEIACKAYIKSFFSGNGAPRVSTARAGNVIGGGDWAADRIVPDCVRAFSKGETLVIRHPGATRPWQHVLEPLSGYLWLGARLLRKDSRLAGESFNFGPAGSEAWTVEEVIKTIALMWGRGDWCTESNPDEAKSECTLLKLSCDKALHYLGWHTVLSFEETVRMTVEAYRAFYAGDTDMYSFTTGQIAEYTEIARRRGVPWATQ